MSYIDQLEARYKELEMRVTHSSYIKALIEFKVLPSNIDPMVVYKTLDDEVDK